MPMRGSKMILIGTVFGIGLSISAPRVASAEPGPDGIDITNTIETTWDYEGSIDGGTNVFSDTVDGTTVYAIVDADGNLTITNIDPFGLLTP